jgi:hypothetical protein
MRSMGCAVAVWVAYPIDAYARMWLQECSEKICFTNNKSRREKDKKNGYPVGHPYSERAVVCLAFLEGKERGSNEFYLTVIKPDGFFPLSTI